MKGNPKRKLFPDGNVQCFSEGFLQCLSNKVNIIFCSCFPKGSESDYPERGI